MAEQQKFTVKVSKLYGDAERVAIGLDIIDHIIERSKSGKDKNNNPFPGYSKEYTKSFDFKLAGKSKSKVDLTLSGEMLSALEILDTKDGEITIGIPANDDFNNAKAEGNIKGTYGKDTPIRGKKRDFMGISQGDLSEIKGKYPVKTKADRLATQNRALELIQSVDIVSDLFERLNIGE